MSASQAERRGFDPRLPLLKVLIVRTDRLGDVILTLPMASAIKKAFPDARVSFLAREYTRPIIERAPDVDEIITIDNQDSIGKLTHFFRAIKPDIVFFPNPRLDTAIAAWMARVPLRIGTGYRWYSLLFNHRIFEHRKTAEHHEAVYNLRMLQQIGISPDYGQLPDIRLRSEEIAFVNEWLSVSLGSSNSKFAVLHVGSRGSGKDWPLDRFTSLAQTLAELPNLSIVLTGMQEDSERMLLLANEIGKEHAFLFIGRPLPELAAILSKASIVVSNSTGPGHLAATLGAPTVGLFPLLTVLSKERWGFRGPRIANVFPEPIADCPNCRQCTCMERLEVGHVMDEVKRLMGKP
jgi:heptosyltransferase-3